MAIIDPKLETCSTWKRFFEFRANTHLWRLILWALFFFARLVSIRKLVPFSATCHLKRYISILRLILFLRYGTCGIKRGRLHSALWRNSDNRRFRRWNNAEIIRMEIVSKTTTANAEREIPPIELTFRTNETSAIWADGNHFHISQFYWAIG